MYLSMIYIHTHTHTYNMHYLRRYIKHVHVINRIHTSTLWHANTRGNHKPSTLHLNPKPYTLSVRCSITSAVPHPSKTLHHTPYTLHPAHYTLHPSLCTLHPTPYILHHTPHTLHLSVPAIPIPPPLFACTHARRAAGSARRPYSVSFVF